MKGSQAVFSTTETERAPEVDHVRLLAVEALHVAPENVKVYRPADPRNLDDRGLRESIRESGLLTPLTVTADFFLVSGHRRLAAVRALGLQDVRCIVLPWRRADRPEHFLRQLVESNRQRVKTVDEQLRERVITCHPRKAHQALLEHRARAVGAEVLDTLELGAVRGRKHISKAKADLLAAVKRVILARRKFWPLSDRQIHYALLNDPPLIHASKPASRYANDKASYRALVDVLTRGRLVGEISFGAIDDVTRPVRLGQGWKNAGDFIENELDNLFLGYRRDYLQGQPRQVEVLAEKLTVETILRPVALKYGVPLTIARGYCSLPPRHAMAQRFRQSGRDSLVLLLVTDHDPDGDGIAESLARSMRDDFSIPCVKAIKVALTAAQVQRFKLPPMMEAKATSSRHAAFVAKHGKDVHELEALRPEDLQQLLDEAIRSVLDLRLFDREFQEEEQEAGRLDGLRRKVLAYLETSP